jgi:hypothetical protein
VHLHLSREAQVTEHVLFVQYPGLYIEDGTEPTYGGNNAQREWAESFELTDREASGFDSPLMTPPMHRYETMTARLRRGQG